MQERLTVTIDVGCPTCGTTTHGTPSEVRVADGADDVAQTIGPELLRVGVTWECDCQSWGETIHVEQPLLDEVGHADWVGDVGNDVIGEVICRIGVDVEGGIESEPI